MDYEDEEYLDMIPQDEHCRWEWHRDHPDHLLTKVYEEILSLIPRKKGEKILDVGCAGGFYCKRLQEMGKQVMGVSLMQADIDHLRTIGCDGYVSDMHDLKMIGNGWVNGVFCSHTMEHSLKPLKALREFYRVTVAGGWLFIVVPERAGRIVSGWRRCEDFTNHIFLPDEGTMKFYLRKAGYRRIINTDIEVNDKDVSVSPLYWNQVYICKK